MHIKLASFSSERYLYMTLVEASAAVLCDTLQIYAKLEMIRAIHGTCMCQIRKYNLSVCQGWGC